jgi:hypothetical protein
MAIIPVGLVVVHDVDQEFYYSLCFLQVCWGVLPPVQEVGGSEGLVHALHRSGRV